MFAKTQYILGEIEYYVLLFYQSMGDNAKFKLFTEYQEKKYFSAAVKITFAKYVYLRYPDIRKLTKNL